MPGTGGAGSRFRAGSNPLTRRPPAKVRHFARRTASGKPARLGWTVRRARSRFPHGNSNGIPDLTDLFLGWRKFLTPDAGTPNMAVAPASAFPPIVVPLIRMPE